MNKLTMFFAFLFLSAFNLTAQNLDQLYRAIGAGDVETIYSFMDNRIDLCLYDEQLLVRKEEAKQKITDFFSQVKPVRYTPKHSGVSKDSNSGFYIGELQTSKGILRVYLYFSSKEGGSKLKEIRFNKA